MRIKTAIAVSLAVGGAIAASTAGGLYVTHQDVDEAIERDEIGHDIVRGVFELTSLTSDYLLHFEKRAQAQWKQRHESLGWLLQEPSFRGGGEALTLATLRAHHAELGEVFARLVAGHVTRRVDEGQANLSLALEQRLVTKLLTKAQTIVAEANELASLSEANSREVVRRTSWLVLVLSASIVVVIGGTWILIVQRVVRPLGELHRGIQILGEGDLDYRIDAIRRDEFGEVANAFDDMAEKIQAATVALDQHSAELAVANQELEAFAYSVSHDLRAPLRSMDGFSQALLEDYADALDSKAKDNLGRIRASSQRMALLIDDILKLSRLARSELDRTKVDLSALAQTIAAELRKTEPTRKVSFNIASGIVADGDASALRAVLENLLGNAWKFTSKHPKSTIEFDVTEIDGKPAYYVRDDGVGFDMAYVDTLFKPFQRLHSTSEFEGSGIGLATVERIVRRHGGHAWAEGAVEQGATVYFTL